MGLFDLYSYVPASQYLSPEERQSASTAGWLNAADAFANMSAPQAGQGKTALQMLTGGTKAFGQGAADYTNQYAKNQDTFQKMNYQRQLSDYYKNNPQIAQTLGMPSDMPMDPATMQKLQMDMAQKKNEYGLKMQYEPQIAGMTAGLQEQAKQPFEQQNAAYKSGLDYSNQAGLKGIDYQNQVAMKALENQYASAKPREVAAGSTLVAPVAGGGYQPVYTAPMDPLKQAQVAEAQQKVADTDRGKNEAVSMLSDTIRDGEALLSSPKLASGVGMSSVMGVMPATDARDFQAKLETFKAKNFLPAVQQLKGMGALSDAEGKKLLASVGSLDDGMSEKEFKSSLKTVIDDLKNKQARMTGSKQQDNSDPLGIR